MSERVMGAIPYITSPDCSAHVEWLKTVFDAKLKFIMYQDEKGERHTGEFKKEDAHKKKNCKVMHASLDLNGGNSSGSLFMSDYIEMPDGDVYLAPMEGVEKGGRGVGCYLQLLDADAVWKKALAEGAKEKVPLKNQFWGEKYGVIFDPWGCEWAITQYSGEREQKKAKTNGTEAEEKLNGNKEEAETGGGKDD